LRLPFSSEQFFQVFVRYNEAVWPAPLVLFALAILALVFGVRNDPGDGRRISAILAALWLWIAVVYHVAFFAAINRAAMLFAIVSAVQAGVFVWLAVARHPLRFRPRANARGIAGILMIGYALIGYPVLGYVLGHRYPATPTFGVPCPTTVFTLGVLLWSREKSARLASIIPLLWAVVGTSAAVSLDVKEDFGLLVAALLTLALGVVRSPLNREPESAQFRSYPLHSP
jgi:hypothetical protein